MECEGCGQVSDFPDGEWTPVHGGRAVFALYECERCGNHQRAR